MPKQTQFEDEPSGIDEFEDIPVQSGKVEFAGLKQATTKAERRRERRRRRNARTGKIAACILLFCVLIAVILSVTVFKETEHVLYGDSVYDASGAPSLAPSENLPTAAVTASPSLPTVPTVSTPMPTLRATVAPNTPPTDPPTSTLAPTSVMVDTYSFEPVADTHVYLDGPYSTQIRGHEERLWVQRGNKESTKPGQEVTLPTIVTLLQFDTKNVSGNGKALPKRSRWPKTEDQVKVTLQINHVPKDDPEYTEDQPVEDMPPVEIEILRLPNNYNYVFESFTGEDFRVAPKVVKEGISITRQSVEATDTQLNIDITPAIFLPEDTTGYGDDQVLLLLKVYWEEKSHEGELFQSRESAGGSPKLLFSNMVE